MAKVDDYQQSFDLAAAELVKKSVKDLEDQAGVESGGDGKSVTLSYMGRPVRVELDPATVTAQDQGPELPLTEQALILHYLVAADGQATSGEWITYREVPSGEFYWAAFCKRAKNPLVQFFGARPALLYDLAPQVGGIQAKGQSGDAAVLVRAFPRVPILYVLWAGDDEFPAEGNVLFDRSVSHYLSTEDVALTAGLPLYKMMALSRGR